MVILQIPETTQRELAAENSVLFYCAQFQHNRYVDVIMVVIFNTRNHVENLIVLASTSKHRAAGADCQQ